MIDMTWLSAIFVGASCLAVGYIVGVRYPARLLFFKPRLAKGTPLVDGNNKTKMKPPLEVEKLAEILEDFKMVLHSIKLIDRCRLYPFVNMYIALNGSTLCRFWL